MQSNIVLIEKQTVYELLSRFISSENVEINQMLLDSFIDDAINVNDYTFNTGLLGAGWLISYLHKNELLDVVDIDNVLHDVDDIVYKLTIKSIVNSKAEVNEVLELIYFVHQRIMNKSQTYNFRRKFVLNESLKLLIDKASILLDSKFTSQLDKSRVLLKYSNFVLTGVNVTEIELPFYKNMEELICHYENNKNHLLTEDFKILVNLLLTSKQYGSSYWVECIESILTSFKGNHPSTTWMMNFSNNYCHEGNIVNVNQLVTKNRGEMIFLLASNLKSCKFSIK